MKGEVTRVKRVNSAAVAKRINIIYLLIKKMKGPDQLGKLIKYSDK